MNGITTVSNELLSSDDDDMFADLPPVDPFDIKKQRIASHITALIVSSGKTRSEVAEEIGIQKSVMSRVLSGKNNTKIGTIWQIASHLGYDFDVIFHSDREQTPSQPWHKSKHRWHEMLPSSNNVFLCVTHRDDVKKEVNSNIGPEFYISVKLVGSDNLKTINTPVLEQTKYFELSNTFPEGNFFQERTIACKSIN